MNRAFITLFRTCHHYAQKPVSCINCFFFESHNAKENPKNYDRCLRYLTPDPSIRKYLAPLSIKKAREIETYCGKWGKGYVRKITHNSTKKT
jgi:hypothetical protein